MNCKGAERIALVAMLATATACAPAAPALPDAAAAARYPDYIYPAVPPNLGTPAAVERHKAGWLWLQAGDLRAAERNFTSSLKLSPAFYPAEAGLGYVALARNHPEAALQHFDRAVVANPRYAPALVGRGEALLATGDREMALKSFEAAVGTDGELGALRSRIDVLRFRGMQDDVAAARKAADVGQIVEARGAYQRAIAASPQSPFLYRELAIVERRAGELREALRLAERAAKLEPAEPRNLILIAELHEASGNFAEAIEAYQSAHELEPDPTLVSRVDGLREKLRLAALPPEFHAIESAPTISRAQLAALFGVRLERLLKRAPRQNPAVVITDTRGSWASEWIMAVARAGVMEVYPNHTFQPNAVVRRGDLAQAASQVLSIIALEKPGLAGSWRKSQRRFADLSPDHLGYAWASLAVEAGVIRPLDGGTFQLTRAVSGAEALEAVKRLEELAEGSSR
jgi:tetratricopeptide (TPR) repeat protein